MTTRVGIAGCGSISKAYIANSARFPSLKIVACADLNMAAATTTATANNLKVMSVENLMADPEIDIVVNLTVPQAHVEVSMAAIAAGKHVHCEKPLGIARDEAKKLVDLATAKNLRVGCAPDTFFGGSFQTCRKVIDDGWIGKPIAGTAFFMCRGPESWHPNPFFFYDKGAGPLFDMGPYDITALINLLGPIKSVSAKTSIGFKERTATCKEHYGKKIPVKTATHATGILEFVNGALITVAISFDVCSHTHPCIEIYGTDGSMQVPDPNGFGGVVKVQRPGNDWKEVPLSHGYTEDNRIIAVVDMASAIAKKRPHRASGELAFHVLDCMCAFEESSVSGKSIVLESTCQRPAVLPMGLLAGEID